MNDLGKMIEETMCLPNKGTCEYCGKAGVTGTAHPLVDDDEKPTGDFVFVCDDFLFGTCMGIE